MSRVTALGYIGCSVSDPAAWEHLLGPLFGLERRDDSPRDRSWYRMDGKHHRLTLQHGKTERLDHIGWEVASIEELHELAGSLRALGETVTRAPQSLCEERHVFALYQLPGPDGVPLELYYGLREEMTPFRPGCGHGGFNTGARTVDDATWQTSFYNAPMIWGHEMLPPPAGKVKKL